MHHTYAYSAEKSRQLDRLAIEHYQYPGALLMQRAGWALFKAIPDNSQHIVIFAGGGNNGGDGYVAGFLALQAGLSVEILSLVPLNDLKGDAWLMANHASQLGVTITPYDGTNRIDENTDVVIDALLGTGLKGPPRGLFATAIQTINQMDAYIIACDIPSGICADTGAAFDKVIAAHRTITMISYKKGLLTGNATYFTGKLTCASLSIDAPLESHIEPDVFMPTIATVKKRIANKSPNTHKLAQGHLVIIAGDASMAGAAILNSMAALKNGAGKVTLLTNPVHADWVSINHPEIICQAFEPEKAQMYRYLFQKAQAVLVGSGMNIDNQWSQKAIQTALGEARCPVVADAAAIDALQNQTLDKPSMIITPHPGEAARLLHTTTRLINQDRFNSASKISHTHGVTTVLKGKGTIIDDNEHTYLSPYGNAVLATAGTGDVLAGFIAGLLAQKFSLTESALFGVSMHGYIADQWAKYYGPAGMTASDLYKHLNLLNAS